MRRFLAWTLAATLCAACGGNVVVDKVGGEGGTSATTTSTTTTNTGSTGATICGGATGAKCAISEWCQWDPPGSCGGFDNTGTCQPKPQGCPADCPGVCGCDGQFYCNACEASAWGVDVSGGDVCFFDGGPPDEYNAFMLPTDAPRYMITKTENTANRCLMIVVGGNLGPGNTNIDVTMGWSVEMIAITPSAADCTPGLSWPPPNAVKADKAKGSIKQDESGWPCVVDVDVTIAFPPGSPAWVPPDDFMQASTLIIANGSCL